MSSTYVNLIVTAVMQQRAQAITSQVGGEAGENMFLTGLATATDDAPTHYISSGIISRQFYGLLFNADQLTEILGGTFTFAEVTELLETSDITQDQPFEAMSRLGLVICTS